MQDEFIKVTAQYEYITDIFNIENLNAHAISIEEFSNSDSLILHILEDEYLDSEIFGLGFMIGSNEAINLGFSGSVLDSFNVDININYLDVNSGQNIPCSTEYTLDTNNIIWIDDSYSLLDNNPCFENDYSINENVVLAI